MNIITKYMAYDGAEFFEEEKCLAHEAECRQIDAIMERLPKIPELPGCGFANGDGYLQHDRDVFLSARRELLLIAKKDHDHKWIDQALADETIHPSWISRILDGAHNKMSRAWYRIMCVDESFREWGQPYYQNNPQEAKQVCLNA